jgi:hypothetical protein
MPRQGERTGRPGVAWSIDHSLTAWFQMSADSGLSSAITPNDGGMRRRLVVIQEDMKQRAADF